MNNIYQDFEQPFIDGAIKTFKDLCGFETQAEPLQNESDSPEMMVIAGIIGITDVNFEGSMVVGFSENGFLETIEKMLGEKYDHLSAEIEDGAAEFANIIFGQAKLLLNEKNHKIKPAIPSVIRGEELNSPDQVNLISRKLFRLPKGVAFIEIAGRATKQSQPEPTQEAVITGPKLDGQVLMSFVDGVRKALQIQCNMEAEPMQPFKRADGNYYQFDIGSIIGVTGATFRGTLSIAFEQKAYLELYYRMTNERHDFVTSEIADGASELMNIIYGIAKVKLNEQGHRLQMALPKLLQGPKMEMRHGSKKPPIAVPFSIEGGTVWVEFAFEDSNE